VLFLKVIENPLMAGRLLSVSAGLATLIGSYLLAKKLFSQKVAIIVGILVVLQPFLLFYDRLALVDSLLTAFGVWSFYLGLLLFKKPTLGKGMLLGTLWGGAMLTKPGGAFFPLMTPPFIGLFPVKKWASKIKKLIVPSLLAAGYGLGFYNILRLSGSFYMISQRSLDYMRPRAELLANPFQFIPGTSRVMFTWLVDYLSWLGILWVGIGLILGLVKKEKKTGLLFLWFLGPFLFQAAVGQIHYARYLLITMPFLLIILAWGITQVWQKFRLKFWLKWGAMGTLVVMVAIWVRFDGYLVANPEKAPLPYGEQEQYLYEWAAGYGIKEVADYLKALPGDQEYIVATEGYFGTLPNGLQIYVDGIDHIKVHGVGQPIHYLPDEVTAARQVGKRAFLVVNSTRLKIEDQSRLKLIAEYPKPEGPKGQEKLLFFEID